MALIIAIVVIKQLFDTTYFELGGRISSTKNRRMYLPTIHTITIYSRVRLCRV